mgnify:CR=1 FL=1
MKIDPSESMFEEAPNAEREFSRTELRHLRLLLRRLRFLEAKAKEEDQRTEASSGAGAFVEWEIAALEWTLDEIGYLVTKKPKTVRRKR